jgi:hypothetical protein
MITGVAQATGCAAADRLLNWSFRTRAVFEIVGARATC